MAEHRSKQRIVLSLLAKYGTIFGLFIMAGIFSVLAPNAFPTFGNLLNVLNQASLTMIIAGGLTVAVIVGELDLSIGFAASYAGVLVTGLIANQGLPVLLAILLVLGCGGLIGLVNGLIVTKVRVNSVIATLGIGTIVVGLNFAYSTGAPIASGVPDEFTDIALGRILGVPNNVIITLFLISVLWVVVERTTLGQNIQAVGGNPVSFRHRHRQRPTSTQDVRSNQSGNSGRSEPSAHPARFRSL